MTWVFAFQVGISREQGCHHLGMWINCQHRAAAATVPLSGAASPTICVSFMTPVCVTALVAIPLLSPLVIGHGTLAIGMSIMLPLSFDHHYSPLPRFGSEVEASLSPSYCLDSLLSWPSGYVLTRSYCWMTAIVCMYSTGQQKTTIFFKDVFSLVKPK
jgi:hypothetical protein